MYGLELATSAPRGYTIKEMMKQAEEQESRAIRRAQRAEARQQILNGSGTRQQLDRQQLIKDAEDTLKMLKVGEMRWV